MFTQYTDESLDYPVAWGTKWLASDDKITASTWTIPSGITKDSDTFDDDTTTVWISGGTAGETYRLINLITTEAGRKKQWPITIRVS